MRHLHGRAALIACALALFTQSALAVPVPKHHHHSASAHFSAHIPVPTARPALSSDPAPELRAGLDDADNLAADDSDTAAVDQPAVPNLADSATAPDFLGSDFSGDDAPRIEVADHRINCVAYVREHTGFAIQGDAHLWWDHAEGQYDRATAPSPQAVMVFAATRGMKRGHVAVVKRLVSDRRIVVDHANWMRDGKIYLNMPVMDVSAANDWSLVRVWNERDHQWGARVYPIRGFIRARPAFAS